MTRMVSSMSADVNAEAVKDAVRSLAEHEFGGRHDYVMALHTDTSHPHIHLTVRTVGNDGVKLNLRKADLQHLRDQFADRLRQRGIEAEATPRHARGVTRKSEKIAVYKIRQRGQQARADTAKKAEVARDMRANGGRLPDYAWDAALLDRRNRVIRTYLRAANALALSSDTEDRVLARDTERFTASLTDLQTERVQMAQELPQERAERPTERRSEAQEVRQQERLRRSREKDRETPDGPDKGPDKDRGGRER